MKVVAFLVLAACNSAPVAGGTTDGPKVFSSVCATCHGPTGKPTGEMVQRFNVRDLTAPEFRARVTPALVENQVRRGSKNKLMPSFEGALSEDQIRSVAAYVAGKTFLARTPARP